MRRPELRRLASAFEAMSGVKFGVRMNPRDKPDISWMVYSSDRFMTDLGGASEYKDGYIEVYYPRSIEIDSMINDIDGLGKSHELSDEEFDEILEEARSPRLKQKIPNTVAFLREVKASLVDRNQDSDLEIKLESADRELWVSVRFNSQGLSENKKFERAISAARALFGSLNEFDRISKKYATKGQSGW